MENRMFQLLKKISEQQPEKVNSITEEECECFFYVRKEKQKPRMPEEYIKVDRFERRITI